MAMKKDPAFLLYSQDFIVGVQTMDFEDRGKYISILAQMHQQGRMSEKTIRFLVGNVSDTLRLKFLVDENGFWYNERLELEIENRRVFVESRRNNGAKGGRPRKEKVKPNAKPNGLPKPNLMEDVNVDVNESVVKRECEGEIIEEFDGILKPVIDSIMDYFGFNELTHPNKMFDIDPMITMLDHNKQLDHFKTQFNNYKLYKKQSGDKVHGFLGFIGTSENRYLDGGWNANNWEHKLNELENESNNNKKWNADEAFDKFRGKSY